MNEFSRWKTAALAKVDLSKKGSIDSEIECLVTYINNQPEYFTTSSCSGRIIICSDDISNTEKPDAKDDSIQKVKKKGCIWYLSSHTVVDPVNAIAALQKVNGPSKMKFEPFVLHVQCDTMNSAQLLHQTAVAAGYRNSGMSFRKGGKKIIAAVRGTACLELPLTDSEGKRLTTDEYINYVVDVANKKLEHNFDMIKAFETKLKYEIDQSSKISIDDETKKKEVYRRKGKIAKESGTLSNLDVLDIDSAFLFHGED